jgi:hypothetical protein
MWTYEHSADAAVSSEQIWSVWSDVAGWPSWNRDIERITIDGPFRTGSTISMTPIGQDAVELRIAEASENQQFVDEATFGEMVIRTIHRIDRLDDEHVRVTYRTEITGEGGESIGPQITADFPETVAALLERARR